METCSRLKGGTWHSYIREHTRGRNGETVKPGVRVCLKIVHMSMGARHTSNNQIALIGRQVEFPWKAITISMPLLQSTYTATPMPMTATTNYRTFIYNPQKLKCIPIGPSPPT